MLKSVWDSCIFDKNQYLSVEMIVNRTHKHHHSLAEQVW